ncbi:DNA polymerase IV [Streptomyces sp. NRRL B-1677]|uniref:DNA polymerase IV n=1 Tax=Streptomyces sp. NRRL B-1677 TaxID=2682966 RepID=UPI001892BE3A|nr:DNA polymerase IV [Streptomyces sp. NRRL B-1677]
MRGAPTILHLDMDAFYASAEQAAKPSLRGKPVVVGGIGPRGVVATASYEARVFGVRSAMATAQARRLCPNAAYLTPRFSLYRDISEVVMGLLGALSPLVEPLSLDEAFVDLEAGGVEPTAAAVRAVGERLRRDIRTATGLSGSVGLAASKMLAKIASEEAKPDGLLLIEPGTELERLRPMSVRAIPGVGPATAETLRRAGITTVAETAEAGEAELVRLLGKAHGAGLYAMATGHDDRPVVAERDAKSVSVEDTFEEDLTDRTRVQLEIARLADRCVQRLRAAGRSGRTVVIKVRSYDFSTLTRSETLRGPTDDPGVVREAAARLLDGVDTTTGVRLLGVGVSGLADYTQEDLFAQAASEAAGAAADAAEAPQGPEEAPGEGAGAVVRPRRWLPGLDVRHAEYGAGWVQGSGVGRVTVRFETPWSEPGRVRTFAVDDPDLEPGEPLPLVRGALPGEDAATDAAQAPPPGPAGDTGAAPLPEPGSAPEADPGSGLGPGPEGDPGPGPGLGPGPVADPVPEEAPEPGTDSGQGPEADSGPGPEPVLNPASGPDPRPHADAGPEAGPGAGPGSVPDPVCSAAPGPEADVGPGPGVRPAAGADPAPVPDPVCGNVPGAAADAEREARPVSGG